MEYCVVVEPHGHTLHLPQGAVLLQELRKAGFSVDAPCGGHGTCGKCRLTVDGREVWTCQYRVCSDITVSLPVTACKTEPELQKQKTVMGTRYAAFDIGTTTVVCFLLDENGTVLAQRSMHNPQKGYGADVISRIQWAIKGERETLTLAIRKGMEQLLLDCCADAGVSVQSVVRVAAVGNPCMQQLFLGMEVGNLASIPFAPMITEAKEVPAKEYFPCCPEAQLTVVPDISGYVGADMLACVLSEKLYEAEDTVLLVDIGTNGEMVLCHGGRMVACSTAAGPALEGANISCGMRAAPGAIDHVTLDGYSVIGGGEATGICGSGLIDCVAVMLKKRILNGRGRVLTANHSYYLTDSVTITQEDIRQLQMAKGAICAGILMLTEYFGISVDEIDCCLLAGAFGTYLDAENACRIGLLPSALAGKTRAVGNRAGEGAKLLALDPGQLALCQMLTEKIGFLELANAPGFQRCFAKCTRFPED